MSFAARRSGHVLAAIVLVSACARFAASLSFHAPWVAPDEMAYGLLGQSLWQTGGLTIRGTAVGYYSLVYPAFVGGALSIGDTAAGIVVLQAVQAVAMSAVAVPVFLWGRRLTGDRWALAAAALSVLPPALAYSGLIMSEAVYYPLVAVALLALARAVQEPGLFRLGLMLASVTLTAAVRLQALVLLPTFATALVLDAFLARDGRALRRYLVALATIAGVVAAGFVAWVATGHGGMSWNALLGAYETVGAETPGVGAVMKELVWGTGGIVLVSFGVPFLATAVLAVRAAAAGEHDATVRAFLATTVAYVACLVLEVGFFAASFVTYVPERYLFTTTPVLFLGLCLWLTRGASRPRVVLLPVVAGTVAVVAAISPPQLFADVGVHDLLTTLTFFDLAAGVSDIVVRTVVVGAVVVGAAAFVLVPPRRAALLAVVVAVGLGALSIGSARAIADRSRQEEAKAFVPADREWIDQAGAGARVALLNTGDREWPIVPRTAFWNQDVTTVARLPGAQGSGAIPQTLVDPGTDGVLRAGDGSVISEPLVAAPTGAVLNGEKVAEIAPTP
ncbi:MAG: hypothetical protein ACXWZP_07420, partial [Gaiellaceae bacterium]